MTTQLTVVPGDRLAETARELGPALAEQTADHDHHGTFVAGGFELLRRSGYLASPVPTDLGGGGATTAQVAAAQRELARWCASTALASTMHLHVVLTTAWRWRKGLDGAEGLLRRVAHEDLIVASTGGGDFTFPAGRATRAEGGWRVSGRKSFVSASPVTAAASTWAITEEGEAIGFGLPFAAPGVTVLETWDAPGMRGTASHDLLLEDVFVPDASVTAKRQPGVFAPVLAIVAAKALSVIAATYLGVADGARDEAVARLRQMEARTADPGVRRTVGLMDQHLLEAGYVLDGLMREQGEDPEPNQTTFVTAIMAKRSIIEHARAVADLAMDAMGGRCYRHGDPLERAWRDLRAGPFHPVDHERTLMVAGDLAFGRELSLV